MNRETSSRIRPLRVVAAAFAMMLAAGAPSGATVSTEGAKCRSAAAKSFSKMLKAANQVVAGCHTRRDEDPAMEATDCNDVATADAEKLKFQKTAAKGIEKIGDACLGLEGELTAANEDGELWYVSCPVPCSGTANPLADMGEVGECMACVAASVAGATGLATLGAPTPAGLGDAERSCRAAMAKAYGKYFGTALKSHTVCQSKSDKGGVSEIEPCASDDPKGKVAGALAAAQDALNEACSAATLASLDGCSASSLEDLRTCTGQAWADAESEAYEAAYRMPMTICPTKLRTFVRAGCSRQGNCPDGVQTGSGLAFGWTAKGHVNQATDGFQAAFDLSCPGSPGACGACEIGGLDVDDTWTQRLLRCEDAPNVSCSTLFGPDPACLGGDCVVFFGPPAAHATPPTFQLCGLTVLSEDITGTFDLDTGETTWDFDAKLKTFFGVSYDTPCPVCIGDATANDGQKDGNCSAGASPGAPCDVQGVDAAVPAEAYRAPLTGTSLDCPPNLGAGISGTGATLALTLTSAPQAMVATDACEPPFDSETCPCGACSHDWAVACRTDADCDALSPGATCGTGPFGEDRRPNNCSDGLCSPSAGSITPSGLGECASGLPADTDRFCDGLLTPDGRGVVFCDSDDDCTGDATDYCEPGECGTCGVEQARTCFLEPLSTVGVTGTENAVLASPFCHRGFPSAFPNTLFGLPGPGSMALGVRFEPRP